MTLDYDMTPPASQTAATTLRSRRLAKLEGFYALVKSRQTLLLLATGVFAYILSLEGTPVLGSVLSLVLALLLSISGCTALNMVLDRDIDGMMTRTQRRPLPTGALSVREAAAFGLALSALGLAAAFWIGMAVGFVILVGFVFDLLVYSLWLKRRSALSIVVGGVSGGMPALAGRVMALGRVDLVGLLFVLSILLWIPSHIVTLSIKYAEDYRRAGVPVWPNVYGERAARRSIAVANLLNVGVLTACGFRLQVGHLSLALLLGSGAFMVVLAARCAIRPSEKSTWLLFKSASIYMLLSFLLITFGVVA